MSDRRLSSRGWMYTGGLIALVVSAIAWLFVLSPDRAHTTALNQRVSDTQVSVATMRTKLAALAAQQEKLGEYQQTVSRNVLALPASDSVNPLLRSLRSSASAVGVTIVSFSDSPPSSVPGATSYALNMTMRVEGSRPGLDNFLGIVQRDSPRALRISAITYSAPSGTDKTAFALALTMQAFVAPGTTSS